MKSVVEVLIEACPSFSAYWAEVGPIYDDLPPQDLEMHDFLFEYARHTLELYQDSKEEALPPIATALSSLHDHGTAKERVIVAWLLKIIGYDWSDNGANPVHFFRYVPNSMAHLCVIPRTEPPEPEIPDEWKSQVRDAMKSAASVPPRMVPGTPSRSA